MCEAEGRVTVASVVDHRTPLWEGGADDYETNGQSLCDPHHDAKTAEEAARRARLG
jgi:5-methylcytosine-specific restriction protein A